MLQTCSPKLVSKAAPESCSPKLRSQRWSPKLKFFKAAVQNCSSKLLPKAAPLRCSTKLCPKLFSKAVAPKLRKAAPQSCCRKLLPKVAFESYSPFFLSNTFMASARSLHTFNRSKKMNCNCHARLSICHKSTGSGPVRSPASCPSKKPKNHNQKQNVRKLLPKGAPQSCRSSKLLLKAAP